MGRRGKKKEELEGGRAGLTNRVWYPSFSGGVGGGGGGWYSDGNCFYAYTARCGLGRSNGFIGGQPNSISYNQGGFGGGAATQNQGE